MATVGEAAYAAGFFDGEGCVRVARLPYRDGFRYLLCITVVQNDPTPLLWLQRLFGGVVYGRTYRIGVRSHGWRIGPRIGGLEFLKAIRPYLIVKAAQVDLAFQFAELPRMHPQKASLFQEMKDAKFYTIRGK